MAKKKQVLSKKRTAVKASGSSAGAASKSAAPDSTQTDVSEGRAVSAKATAKSRATASGKKKTVAKRKPAPKKKTEAAGPAKTAVKAGSKTAAKAKAKAKAKTKVKVKAKAKAKAKSKARAKARTKITASAVVTVKSADAPKTEKSNNLNAAAAAEAAPGDAGAGPAEAGTTVSDKLFFAGNEAVGVEEQSVPQARVQTEALTDTACPVSIDDTEEEVGGDSATPAVDDTVDAHSATESEDKAANLIRAAAEKDTAVSDNVEEVKENTDDTFVVLLDAPEKPAPQPVAEVSSDDDDSFLIMFDNDTGEEHELIVDVNDVGVCSITLPSDIRLQTLDGLKDSLVSHMDVKSVTVDTGQVKRMDSASFQLLWSYSSSLKDMNIPLEIVGASDEFASASKMLGLGLQ